MHNNIPSIVNEIYSKEPKSATFSQAQNQLDKQNTHSEISRNQRRYEETLKHLDKKFISKRDNLQKILQTPRVGNESKTQMTQLSGMGSYREVSDAQYVINMPKPDINDF